MRRQSVVNNSKFSSNFSNNSNNNLHYLPHEQYYRKRL